MLQNGDNVVLNIFRYTNIFCFVPQIGPNPCNHYYWEDGDDSYVDFLVSNGYLSASGNVGSAGDMECDGSDGEEDGSGEHMMDVVGKKMDTVVKKLDELIEICRNVFVAIVFLIAVVTYVAVVGK